jgi:hypothetical protein
MNEKSSKKEYKEGDTIRVGNDIYEYHKNLGIACEIAYICAYCGKEIPRANIVVKKIEGRDLDTYHKECVDLVI